LVRRILGGATAGAVAIALTSVAVGVAHPPDPQLSGAIFTTDASGEPVNLNIYDAKEDVTSTAAPASTRPTTLRGSRRARTRSR
jgi:hypothetical protein